MANKTYNGHKNWNHWNVSLWIGNYEPLYRLAQRCIVCESTKDAAAARLLGKLGEMGLTHTPDGAPYTFSSLRAAIVVM